MKRTRIYVDTSVLGGCLDEEFMGASMRFIEKVRSLRYTLLVSQTLVEELEEAPQAVRDLLAGLPPDAVERVDLTAEMLELQQAYLDAEIVGPRWADDALHVATATVARADAIVSWNFKHIVRLDKIRAYNQVNYANGYGIMTILSPLEVIEDDDEDSDEDS